MSMLQKILEQMYVEPELLAQLDEEQKQVLFIKMREEQMKRWRQREEDLERQEKSKSAAKNGELKRRVQWLSGVDGNVWVWVMGDHPNDKSIEQILEDEAMLQARLLAEKELKTQEEALKNELSRQGAVVGENASTESAPLPANSVQISLYEDANNFVAASPVINNSSTSTGPQPFPVTSLDDETRLLSKLRETPVAISVESMGRKPMTRPPPPPVPSKIKLRPVATKTNANSSTVDDDTLEKRQSEIYQSIKEAREKIAQEAEKEADKERQYWEEQERRSREAEAAIRKIAQNAREQHRQQSLRTSTSILPALQNASAHTSLRDAIKNLPRPPKPKSRQAIIEWFQRDELPRGTGLDPKTRLVAPWFHGIISREQSEALLKSRPTGSFLVRVSERIWGYTVSYVSIDGVCRHFLVERIPEGYQFLGTNQVVHDHLYDLICYHETAPITAKGNEILKTAVGQSANGGMCDYDDLMSASLNQVLRF
uniref:SH2 domain-containing protein n=1 Tax=Plectus sambesii TaxID=2011161 RepID=A0A914VD87_9BILA